MNVLLFGATGMIGQGVEDTLVQRGLPGAPATLPTPEQVRTEHDYDDRTARARHACSRAERKPGTRPGDSRHQPLMTLSLAHELGST